MASPSTKHDHIRFAAPKGTRDQYRQIAALAGTTLNRWCREALRKAALEALEEHGVEMKLLPVHSPKPKRLQPRIKIPKRPAEDET